MIKRIVKLTPEQEALLPVIRDNAIKKAFSTPLNKEKCLSSIYELYAMADLKTPIVLFMDSPLSVQYGANYAVALLSALSQANKNEIQPVEHKVVSQVMNQVWNQVENQVENQVRSQVENQVRSQVIDRFDTQVGNQVGNQVRSQVIDRFDTQVGNQVRSQVENQVWNLVWNQVWNQVENQVENQVWNQVENQVRTQVRTQVINQVGNQVGNQVWNQVRTQVMNQVGNQVGIQVGNQVRTQVMDQVGNMEYYSFSCSDQLWDSSWVSFYDYFQTLGIVDNDNFEKYKEYLSSGPYFTVFLEGLAIVGQCPKEIHRDEKNNLHSTTGPSIVWDDGYGQHYVHGIFFEHDEFIKYFIDNSFIPEDIFTLRNAEQRTALIKHYGYAYFIDSLKNKKTLDTFNGEVAPKALRHMGFSAITKQPVSYELIEFEIGEGLRSRVIKVECHTEHKPTFLGVPIQKSTETVFGALAWTVPPELNGGKEMTGTEYITLMKYET